MSFNITTLFKHIPPEFERLFSVNSYPWDAIKHILNIAVEHKKGVEVYENLTSGIPLDRHVVFLPDGQTLQNGFELRFASKGAQVIYRGEILPDASVLMAGSVFLGNRIHIGKGVVIEPGACIQGPALLGDGTQVRHGAYIRGGCFTGKKCVIGHATEVKNAIFMDGAKAGHFAYVGDSILGCEVNLGAGTKLANLKFKGNVTVRFEGSTINTGLRKFGAILGDSVQTGCNSVCNPGSVVGCDSIIMANVSVKSGYYPPHSIIRQ